MSAFPSALLFHAVLFVALHLLLFLLLFKDYRFSSLLFSSSLQFFSATLIFFINCCSWNSTAFLLFVQFVYTLVHCSFSLLSRISTIVFPPLSLYRFPIVLSFLLFYLWFVSIVSPFFFYRFLLLSFFPSYFSCSEVYPLFLSHHGLLLFVVNQLSVTCHDFGLLLFSILSVDRIVLSFTLPLTPCPYVFPLFCNLYVINNRFFFFTVLLSHNFYSS